MSLLKPRPTKTAYETASSQFSTEERCRELIRRLRWPLGVECLRCRERAVELETKKDLFYCKTCDYQFSATAGTIFNDSHLPLEKWFIAILLLCEAKNGLSARQVQRKIGVSYKTAWYLCHRIRAAMGQSGSLIGGSIAEMEGGFDGGKPNRQEQLAKTENNEVLIGLRKHGGKMRLFHTKDIMAGSLAQYIRQNVNEDFDILLTENVPAHLFALKRPETEMAFNQFKKDIRGSWHHVSTKHLAAYLEEMRFRFARRNKSNLFLETLRRMATRSVLTFEKLIT
jgi:transposase-like protein